MAVMDMAQRKVLQDLILVYLKRTQGDVLAKIHAEGHKMWAIGVLLDAAGDQNLVDWTVEQMKFYPVGTFPYQNRYAMARAGASPEVFEELLADLIKNRHIEMAEQCAERAGRKLTAGEVLALGRAYTDGAMRSDPDLQKLRQLFLETPGADVDAFDRMNAEQRERFSDPY